MLHFPVASKSSFKLCNKEPSLTYEKKINTKKLHKDNVFKSNIKIYLIICTPAYTECPFLTKSTHWLDLLQRASGFARNLSPSSCNQPNSAAYQRIFTTQCNFIYLIQFHVTNSKASVLRFCPLRIRYPDDCEGHE